MDILLLTTPVQHADSNPAVISQPKALQAWCDSLPTMNVIETVNMLKSSIHPFNEMKIKSQERLKLLEIYRTTFEDILSSYDELRLRTLPIPTEQRDMIAEDIMWLYLDLANGYKILIKEAYETDNIKTNNAIISSLYRAMELLITSLIYATKAHAKIPQLVQLEIKQLYLLAETHDVLDNKVKTIKDRVSPATVNNLFKQYILFSTVKENTFQSEDILEFFTLIDNFSIQTRLISDQDIEDYQYVYCVDLIDDNTPRIMQKNDLNKAADSRRLIDINKTIETMRAISKQKTNNESSFIENKEIQLLKTYINSVYTNPGTINDQAKKHIKLARGIETIHYLLEHQPDINDLFEKENNNGIEVQNFNLKEELLQNISDWNLIEEADTARILTSKKDSISDHVKIDDFVALIQKIGINQPPVIITGVVRKIRDTDSDIIKIGIEVMPGQPRPFSYIRRNGKEHIENGLYLPPITALKRPASLVIKSNNFNNGINCSIRINNQEITVQATDTILKTKYFTQFSFLTVN